MADHKDTTEEIWKPVLGYEELYEVSNYGRVRTTPRILRQSPSSQLPYPLVHLRKDGQTHGRLVHRLVLEAFVGPAPEGMEACHNDGNATNAHLGNLRWDTKKNNAADRKRHGTEVSGEQNSHVTLTREDVTKIQSLLLQGMKQSEIASMFNVVQTTISHINLGKHWTQSGTARNMFPLMGDGKKGSPQNLLPPPKKGDNHHLAKRLDIDAIMALHDDGLPQWAIAKRLGTSQMVISRILRGLHWSQEGQNQAPKLPPYEGPTRNAKSVDIGLIQSLRENGLSQDAIAKQLQLSQILVSRVLRGTHWSQRQPL